MPASAARWSATSNGTLNTEAMATDSSAPTPTSSPLSMSVACNQPATPARANACPMASLRTVPSARRLARMAERVHRGQHVVRVAEELLACRSERDVAGRTVEQADSQLAFEALDALGQRWLGDVQPRWRPARSGARRPPPRSSADAASDRSADHSDSAIDSGFGSVLDNRGPSCSPACMDTAGGSRTVEARSSGRWRVTGLAGAVAGLLLAGAAGCGDDGVGDEGPAPGRRAWRPPRRRTPASRGVKMERWTTGGTSSVPATGGPTNAWSSPCMVGARRPTRCGRSPSSTGRPPKRDWRWRIPDALDRGWGDDTFTSPTRPVGDEDVAFLDALVRELRADPRIDDGPIGVVGFSNGASMALRYTSEHPDEVRAVVSVAGQLPRDPAIRPSGRVPLLEVYGTADPLRPYDSGIPETPGRGPGDPDPHAPDARHGRRIRRGRSGLERARRIGGDGRRSRRRDPGAYRALDRPTTARWRSSDRSSAVATPGHRPGASSAAGRTSASPPARSMPAPRPSPSSSTPRMGAGPPGADDHRAWLVGSGFTTRPVV